MATPTPMIAPVEPCSRQNWTAMTDQDDRVQHRHRGLAEVQHRQRLEDRAEAHRAADAESDRQPIERGVELAPETLEVEQHQLDHLLQHGEEEGEQDEGHVERRLDGVDHHPDHQSDRQIGEDHPVVEEGALHLGIGVVAKGPVHQCQCWADPDCRRDEHVGCSWTAFDESVEIFNFAFLLPVRWILACRSSAPPRRPRRIFRIGRIAPRRRPDRT